MPPAIDLAPFLLPDGEVRCAWRRRDGAWELTIATARRGRRRVRIYEVDPVARRARLVGEIGHLVGEREVIEDRRRRAGGTGAPVAAIVIPRRLHVGETVSTVGGAATVTLASRGRRWGRRAIVLAASERTGGTGELELVEGIGEVRLGAEKRAVFAEGNGVRVGREPGWWRGLRLVGARLRSGADSAVL